MNLCFLDLKRHCDRFLDVRVHGFFLNAILKVFLAVTFDSRLINALCDVFLIHIIFSDRLSLQVFSFWFFLFCDLIFNIFESRWTNSYEGKYKIDKNSQNQDAWDNPSEHFTQISDFCLIKYLGVQEVRE